MALAILDFNREDLFLWITLVFTALSKVDMAFLKLARASFFFPAAISFLTSLTASLNLSLTFKLRARRLMDCFMAFAADLVLGMNLVNRD